MIDYIIQRPDHLFSESPKTEEPFSTPRSWHMLSDALTEYGSGKRAVSMETLKMLAYACISDAHEGMFLAYTKTLRNTHLLDEIIAQMTVAADDQEALPDRFMMEVIRDLPRLVH